MNSPLRILFNLLLLLVFVAGVALWAKITKIGKKDKELV